MARCGRPVGIARFRVLITTLSIAAPLVTVLPLTRAGTSTDFAASLLFGNSTLSAASRAPAPAPHDSLTARRESLAGSGSRESLAGSGSRDSLAGSADDVLRLINRERAAAHCRPVREHPALSRAAQRHSDHMARTASLSHTGPGRTRPGSRLTAEGYRWSRAGENLAQGQPDAATVVRDWADSPEHRTILLTCAYEHAGVGISEGRDGPWWTATFAAHR